MSYVNNLIMHISYHIKLDIRSNAEDFSDRFFPVIFLNIMWKTLATSFLGVINRRSVIMKTVYDNGSLLILDRKKIAVFRTVVKRRTKPTRVR